MYRGDLPLDCKLKPAIKINWRFFLAVALSALLHLLLYLVIVNREQKSALIESDKQEQGIEVTLTTLPAAKPAAQPPPSAPAPPPPAKPIAKIEPALKPAPKPPAQARPKPPEKSVAPKPAKPAHQTKPPTEKPAPEFKDDFGQLSKSFKPDVQASKPEEPPAKPPEKAVEPEPAKPVQPPKPPEEIPLPASKEDAEQPSPAPVPAKPENQPTEPSEKPPEKTVEPKPAKPAKRAKPAKEEPLPAFKDDFGQLSSHYSHDSPDTQKAAPSSTGGSAKADTGIRPGAILNINPRIHYPLNAMRRGQRGVVVVLIHITTEGQVSDVDLIQSSGYDELDNQVLGAVQHWRFTAPRRGNMPVESTYKHTVIFGTDEQVIDDFATHWQQIKLLPADGKR